MTARPTRRAFIAGAVAAGAAPAVARGDGTSVAPMRAKRETVRLGRAIAVSPHGGRIVVAHERRRTIAILTPSRGRSKIVDVGGQPVDVAVSPDGRVAVVTTGFWDKPGLVVVDLHSGTVTKHVDVGPAPFAAAFTPSGNRLVVSGGEQEGTVHVLGTKAFAVLFSKQIGTVPRGIAPVASGDAVWIAINGRDQVVRVNLKTGKIEKTVSTPWLPDRVAVSPDGKRLLVTHGGPQSDHVSEIEIANGHVHSHNVGRHPSAVAWTANGHRLVALGGASEVIRIGAAHRRVKRRVAAGPRGLAVAGGRAWTVSAITGEVSAVRT